MKKDCRSRTSYSLSSPHTPRRCGWFDSVLVRYSVVINNVDELAIMKLDVLGDLNKIRICTGYKYKGKIYKEFPMDFEVLSNVQPVYEELDGWRFDISAARTYAQLPANARRYIERLERLLKVGVKYISIGTKRSEIITR